MAVDDDRLVRDGDAEKTVAPDISEALEKHKALARLLGRQAAREDAARARDREAP